MDLRLNTVRTLYDVKIVQKFQSRLETIIIRSSMKILTTRQMSEIDQISGQEYNLPERILMENAGFQVFRTLLDFFPERLENQRIGILCGKGNNGGDGLVVARLLSQAGLTPSVFLLATNDKFEGNVKENLNAYRKAGGTAQELTSASEFASINWDQYNIFIDAILGTGLTRPLAGLYAQVVEELNRSTAFCLAVDIPTGMQADSMASPSLCICADVTVTFTAPKIAHILNSDQDSLGKLCVVPIGSPRPLLDSNNLWLSTIEKPQVAECLPRRPIDSHKGNFGHIAIVGGSREKSGAARLAAWSALRTGAGLVTVFVPDIVQAIVAESHAELMTRGLPTNPEGELSLNALDVLQSSLEEFNCLVLGPGLGTRKETRELIKTLVDKTTLPIVLDADGINAFQSQRELLQRDENRPLILTPHPREFARIIDLEISEIRANRCNIARRFATEYQVWLVLKDFRTLIASPDGKVQVCPLGNPGMATAGSGDVLAGIIGALTGIYQAQHLRSLENLNDAIMTAVYLHSASGDLAAQVTEHSVTASGIIDQLPEIFRHLENLDQ
jgi:NAD(P)H-hydrate epimerase